MPRFREMATCVFLLVFGLTTAGSFVAGTVLAEPGPPELPPLCFVSCSCRDVQALVFQNAKGELAEGIVYYRFDEMGKAELSTQAFSDQLSLPTLCLSGQPKIVAGTTYNMDAVCWPICILDVPDTGNLEARADLPEDPPDDQFKKRAECK